MSPEPRLRPIIRVTLKYGDTVQDFDALVDSGSDVTLSYVTLGVPMGLKLNYDDTAKKKIETLTGLPFDHTINGLGKEPVKVCVVPAKLVIYGKEITASIHWIKEDFNSATDFSIVLGQDTIFSLFDIHFSKRQHKFFLNEKVLTPDNSNNPPLQK